MFVHFRTLGTLLAVATILTACAEFNQTPKPQPKVSSDIVIKPKNVFPQRNEKPINTVRSHYGVDGAAQCLQQHIADDFKLPNDFYTTQRYDGGEATVQLVNPATGKGGLYIDIVPDNGGSILLLYQNRATISNAWKRLPEKCR